MTERKIPVQKDDLVTFKINTIQAAQFRDGYSALFHPNDIVKHEPPPEKIKFDIHIIQVNSDKIFATHQEGILHLLQKEDRKHKRSTVLLARATIIEGEGLCTTQQTPESNGRKFEITILEMKQKWKDGERTFYALVDSENFWGIGDIANDTITVAKATITEGEGL